MISENSLDDFVGTIVIFDELFARGNRFRGHKGLIMHIDGIAEPLKFVNVHPLRSLRPTPRSPFEQTRLNVDK